MLLLPPFCSLTSITPHPLPPFTTTMTTTLYTLIHALIHVHLPRQQHWMILDFFLYETVCALCPTLCQWLVMCITVDGCKDAWNWHNMFLIVCGTDDNTPFMIECMHAGAVDYLLKPLPMTVIKTLFLVRSKHAHSIICYPNSMDLQKLHRCRPDSKMHQVASFFPSSPSLPDNAMSAASTLCSDDALQHRIQDIFSKGNRQVYLNDSYVLILTCMQIYANYSRHLCIPFNNTTRFWFSGLICVSTTAKWLGRSQLIIILLVSVPHCWNTRFPAGISTLSTLAMTILFIVPIWSLSKLWSYQAYFNSLLVKVCVRDMFVFHVMNLDH